MPASTAQTALTFKSEHYGILTPSGQRSSAGAAQLPQRFSLNSAPVADGHRGAGFVPGLTPLWEPYVRLESDSCSPAWFG